MNDDKKGTIKVDMGAQGIKTIKVDYPSNSYKDREEKEQKRVEKIVKGPIIKKKKSFGKKLLETFVGDDINNVASYIIYDVLIPAAKNAISDMVQGGIEMLLFGEKKGSRTYRDRGRTYVSYNSYYKRDDRRELSSRSRATYNFDDIIFGSRGEAEEVLSNLVDLTIDYGQATVADFYELVGVTGSFTDNKYGWTDLSSASVSRVREGYVINFPRAILLD